MSATTTASSAGSADQIFLRWSDGPGLPFREELVEVIGSNHLEPVIRSVFRVSEGTKVLLIVKDYTGSGIVHSCHKQGNCFILTIHISSEYTSPELLPQYDPGLFAVDGFLTEEEEAKILESLKRSNGAHGVVSTLLSPLAFFAETTRKAFRLYNIQSSMQLNPQ